VVVDCHALQVPKGTNSNNVSVSEHNFQCGQVFHTLTMEANATITRVSDDTAVRTRCRHVHSEWCCFQRFT
jgi:hypothetical protein